MTIASARMTSGERNFEGRVAIVTGAARGLGRAAAERLYERMGWVKVGSSSSL